MKAVQGSESTTGLDHASAIFQNRVLSGSHASFSPSKFSDTDTQGAVAGAKSVLLMDLISRIREPALKVVMHTTDA